MELLSNGYERNIFSGFREHDYSYRTKTIGSFSFSKNGRVYYRVACRFKNTGKKFSKFNTETLHLEIDHNLSSDFNFNFIDKLTGESLVVNLLSTEQKDFGDTSIEISFQYINSKQELFENNEKFYCSSIGGTIENRLKHYKKFFDEKCNELVADFKANGFKVHHSHIVNNLAAYILHEAHKKNNRISVYSSSPTNQVNNWLIVFSVLNNDCFFQDYLSPTATKTRFGYPWANLGNRYSSELMPVRLPVEQVEIFEQIFNLPGSLKYDIEHAIDDCCSPAWSGQQLNYSLFKYWLLEKLNKNT